MRRQPKSNPLAGAIPGTLFQSRSSAHGAAFEGTSVGAAFSRVGTLVDGCKTSDLAIESRQYQLEDVYTEYR